MKVEEVIKVLTEFNKWRRGEPPYEWNEDPSKQKELSYSAKEVGIAIDEAINMLKHADDMERDEKQFIIRSNDDGSVWVSPHRWLKGHCAKATIFSSAFYAKKAVEFENKSKSGRNQLPQVYEIMEDGRLRLVSEEECAK